MHQRIRNALNLDCVEAERLGQSSAASAISGRHRSAKPRPTHDSWVLLVDCPDDLKLKAVG